MGVRSAALVAVLACVVVPGLARADDAAPVVPPMPEAPSPDAPPATEPAVVEMPPALLDPDGGQSPARHWYGWQTLIADAAALSVMAVATQIPHDGGADPGTGVAMLGFLAFWVTPPIIHAVHHRRGIAWASFGLRIGAPMLGLVIGVVADGNLDGRHNPPTGETVALAVGWALPVLLDAAAFAYDNPQPQPPTSHGITVVPVGAPRREGGLDIGLVGTF